MEGMGGMFGVVNEKSDARNGSKKHKNGMKEMMSLQDITTTLQEHLPEEIEDAKHYMHMAKSAEEMGNAKLAKYLFAVSKDEYTHAEFIYDYLKDAGLAIPEDQVVAFEELKTKAMRIFR